MHKEGGSLRYYSNVRANVENNLFDFCSVFRDCIEDFVIHNFAEILCLFVQWKLHYFLCMTLQAGCDPLGYYP